MKTRKQISAEFNVTVDQFRAWERKASRELECSFGQVNGSNQPKTYSDHDIDLIFSYAPENSLNQEESLATKASIVPQEDVAILPVHTTEVLSANGYGKNFDLGSPITLNLHIHVGHTEQFNNQSESSDSNVQLMLNQILSADHAQGTEDAKEVESVAQAVKSKRIETRIAGHAAAMGKPDRPSESTSQSS